MLAEAKAEWEIGGAKQILEDQLGQEVAVLAYPYGLATATHRRMAAARSRAAYSTDLGTAQAAGDRHWLRRIDMYYYRVPALFRLFPTATGHAYLRLRALGRAC